MIACEEALYSRASLVYDRFVESASDRRRLNIDGCSFASERRPRDHSRRLIHGCCQKSCEEAGESRRQEAGESCEEEEVVAKLFALGSQSLASAS